MIFLSMSSIIFAKTLHAHMESSKIIVYMRCFWTISNSANLLIVDKGNAYEYNTG